VSTNPAPAAFERGKPVKKSSRRVSRRQAHNSPAQPNSDGWFARPNQGSSYDTANRETKQEWK